MTAEDFNGWYSIGHPVIYTNDYGEEIKTNTRSRAWELGHGAPVVLIVCVVGCISLDRIKPLETHTA